MSTEEHDNSDAAEETKRKFREALDRKKNANQGKGEAHLDGDSAVHDSHGPAASKRAFARRKSG